MEAKTKIIASIVAVSLVAVFSIVGLIVVLSAYTANLTNSYNISYSAQGVACDVSASYRKATTGETTAGSYTTIKSGTSDKITFTGKDTSSTEGGYSASFNALSDQAITKTQYFVLRYIIANNKTNSIDMVVSLNITTTTDPVNFNVSYAYTTESTDLSTNLTTNKSKFSSTFTPQELKSGSTAYIYVLCEIANLDIDASFVGTANWELVDKNEFNGDYEIQWNYAEIKSGKYVCSAIKGYANTDTNYNTSNTDVQSITFGNLNEYSSVVSSVSTPIDISANNDGSVKVYRVGSSTYDVYVLATEPNTKIKFNSDSSSMFHYCGGLSELDLSNLDTSSVTSMSYMFYNCGGLSTLDVSNFDTNSVTNMHLMFGYCSVLSELEVSNFDTSSVTDMSYMFQNCSGLSTLDVSNFDTSSVTNMARMFSGCKGLSTLDVSNFDTSSVKYMSYMFYGCSGLTAIYIGSGWSTASVTKGVSMFYGCTSLPNYNSSYVTHAYCSRYMTLKS